MPVIICRIVNKRKILSMIVVIMGEHIKAHTAEHLLDILWMSHTQNFHQRVIIHA